MTTKILLFAILSCSWFPIGGPLQIVGLFGIPCLIGMGFLLRIVSISLADLGFLFLFAAFNWLSSALHLDTGPINPTMGLITYCPVLLLAVRFNDSDGSIFVDFINITCWLTLLEAAVGVAQYGYGILQHLGPGELNDSVRGTLMGIQSHPYALKMLYNAVILFSVLGYHRVYKLSSLNQPFLFVSACAASVAAVLANFLSGTILFMAGLTLFGCFRAMSSFRRWKVQHLLGGMLALVMMASVFGVYFLVDPGALGVLSIAVQEYEDGGVAVGGRFQKFQVMANSVRNVLLANPWNASFGIGIGRYSSRAALLLSNCYFTNRPEVLPISESADGQREIYSIMYHVAMLGDSVMAIPISTLQSVLIEVGIGGSVAIVLFFWSICARANWLVRMPAVQGTLRFVLLSLIPALLMSFTVVCLSDDWLEYSAVTTPIFTLIAVALSR